MPLFFYLSSSYFNWLFLNFVSVNIKGAITEIPATMFFSCEKLKEVKLHNEIHKIGQHAFTFCKELEHINLENVKIIEDFAFTETKFKNNQLEYEEER